MESGKAGAEGCAAALFAAVVAKRAGGVLPGFDRDIYRLICEIPPARVATYGQLAVMAGMPGGARRAGLALSRAPCDIPSHRVVNGAGRLVPGWPLQRALLAAEGVAFRQNGCVDMRRHRWRPL